jgi:hypothetical protein
MKSRTETFSRLEKFLRGSENDILLFKRSAKRLEIQLGFLEKNLRLSMHASKEPQTRS